MLRKIATIRLILILILILSQQLFAGRLTHAADLPTLTEIVGTVTTVIGESRILSGAGQEQSILRGVSVRVGDRIETAVGGHVHIRFIDGGLVSVRPLSRLLIEAYRNNTNRDIAAIKFHLEEGVIRSVTGEWGEAHRDRFRLNTPVAAIGIKGTDFIVKADQANTFASVVTGAIVMAPLEGPCAQTLGPCVGNQSVLLSAEMIGMMLELQRQNGHTPRLVPAVDLLAGQGRGDVQRPSADLAGRADIAEKPAISDSGAVSRLAENSANAAIPPVSKSLKWLHNAFDWNVPANSFSQRYSEALADGRKAVIGNLFITLYRDETTQAAFPIRGTATLALKNASATYTQPVAYNRPTEDIAISGATLNIDFTRATFTTRMDLVSPSLGRTEFATSGSVSKNGIFTTSQTGQNLAGAFSMDGREAGYQFAKTLPGGLVSGITLWGR
ncbi:MAG: FecR family protein [Azonexus sp.]|nr:FecR family protein [Azonexus sp.]